MAPRPPSPLQFAAPDPLVAEYLHPNRPCRHICPFTQLQEEEEDGEDAYVAAVEGPLPGRAGAAAERLGGRAARCDEFVNQAMQEMGNINICGWLLLCGFYFLLALRQSCQPALSWIPACPARLPALPAPALPPCLS